MTDPLHAIVLVCTLKPLPGAVELGEARTRGARRSSSDARRRRRGRAGRRPRRPLRRQHRRGRRRRVARDPRARCSPPTSSSLATPIWMGQPGLGVQDGARAPRRRARRDRRRRAGRSSSARSPCVAVVGNEDGAHHVSAEVFQALNDVGFTHPGAAPSPTGSARRCRPPTTTTSTRRPEKTAGTTATLAANTVHLARLLKGSPYPVP